MNFLLRHLIRAAVADGEAAAVYAEVRAALREFTPVEPFNEREYTVDQMCRRNFESTQLRPQASE